MGSVKYFFCSRWYRDRLEVWGRVDRPFITHAIAGTSVEATGNQIYICYGCKIAHISRPILGHNYQTKTYSEKHDLDGDDDLNNFN